MKKTILLITIILVVSLLIPALSFAQPKDYLNAESSSYGLAISKEAKKEAIQAKADRFLLYQNEIIALDADSLELQTSAGDSLDSISLDSVGGGAGIPDISPTVPDGGEDDPPPVNDPPDTDTGTCGKLGCKGGDRPKNYE